VLPAVDTSKWSTRTMNEHVAEVRGMFLEALGQAEDFGDDSHPHPVGEEKHALDVRHDPPARLPVGVYAQPAQLLGSRQLGQHLSNPVHLLPLPEGRSEGPADCVVQEEEEVVLPLHRQAPARG